MLSYRHAFHAGNFADVHKHSVLSLLVQHLLRKDSPFCYLDSHAAAGRYDLRSAEAQRNGEYHHGIQRLWQQRGDPPEVLLPYLAAIRALNPGKDAALPRYYPGSPRIVRHLLRPQDRMVLTELHPADIQHLRREFAADRQVAVHHLDGYQGLKAFLPPKERRGLVLIDPAYERREEAERLLAGLRNGYQRWAQGIFALWLPITNRGALTAFHRKLEKSAIPKILSCELTIRPPLTARQLNGSCMMIINPPWQVDRAVSELQTWLATLLAADGQGEQRVHWLVEE